MKTRKLNKKLKYSRNKLFGGAEEEEKRKAEALAAVAAAKQKQTDALTEAVKKKEQAEEAKAATAEAKKSQEAALVVAQQKRQAVAAAAGPDAAATEAEAKTAEAAATEAEAKTVQLQEAEALAETERAQAESLAEAEAEQVTLAERAAAEVQAVEVQAAEGAKAAKEKEEKEAAEKEAATKAAKEKEEKEAAEKEAATKAAQEAAATSAINAPTIAHQDQKKKLIQEMKKSIFELPIDKFKELTEKMIHVVNKSGKNKEEEEEEEGEEEEEEEGEEEEEEDGANTSKTAVQKMRNAGKYVKNQTRRAFNTITSRSRNLFSSGKRGAEESRKMNHPTNNKKNGSENASENAHNSIKEGKPANPIKSRTQQIRNAARTLRNKTGSGLSYGVRTATETAGKTGAIASAYTPRFSKFISGVGSGTSRYAGDMGKSINSGVVQPLGQLIKSQTTFTTASTALRNRDRDKLMNITKKKIHAEKLLEAYNRETEAFSKDKKEELGDEIKKQHDILLDNLEKAKSEEKEITELLEKEKIKQDQKRKNKNTLNKKNEFKKTVKGFKHTINLNQPTQNRLTQSVNNARGYKPKLEDKPKPKDKPKPEDKPERKRKKTKFDILFGTSKDTASVMPAPAT